MGIRKGCVPRRDLLSGRINLGDFTASLGEVHDSYRAGAGASRTVYTDARTFFSEGTYATDNTSCCFRTSTGEYWTLGKYCLVGREYKPSRTDTTIDCTCICVGSEYCIL